MGVIYHQNIRSSKNYTVQAETLFIATNILQYFLPQIKIWLNKKKRPSTDREDSDEKGELYVRPKKRWENDKDLLPENPLSFDYIEMVIQESYRTIGFTEVAILSVLTG